MSSWFLAGNLLPRVSPGERLDPSCHPSEGQVVGEQENEPLEVLHHLPQLVPVQENPPRFSL